MIPSIGLLSKGAVRLVALAQNVMNAHYVGGVSAVKQGLFRGSDPDPAIRVIRLASAFHLWIVGILRV